MGLGQFEQKSGAQCECVIAKVYLVCGNRTEIIDVTEPQTCQYVVQLSTPLVCHPDSMLVFPTLSDALQDAWDQLEGLNTQNIFTQQVSQTWIVFLVLYHHHHHHHYRHHRILFH